MGSSASRVCFRVTPIFSFSRADSSSLSDPLSDSSSLPDPLSDSLSLRLAVFETVIRLLGGLISAYDMSGDKALLDIAEDLGDRLHPACAICARWELGEAPPGGGAAGPLGAGARSGRPRARARRDCCSDTHPIGGATHGALVCCYCLCRHGRFSRRTRPALIVVAYP